MKVLTKPKVDNEGVLNHLKRRRIRSGFSTQELFPGGEDFFRTVKTFSGRWRLLTCFPDLVETFDIVLGYLMEVHCLTAGMPIPNPGIS